MWPHWWLMIVRAPMPQARLAAGDIVLGLTARSSSPVVCCQTCQHDILKANEPILMRKLAQVIHGARSWNDPLSGSGGQRSRSHEAEDRFEGLAEATVSTSSVGLLVCSAFCLYSLRPVYRDNSTRRRVELSRYKRAFRPTHILYLYLVL